MAPGLAFRDVPTIQGRGEILACLDHQPQHSQQAAVSAHPQAGSDRTPAAPAGGSSKTQKLVQVWQGACLDMERLLAVLLSCLVLTGAKSPYFHVSCIGAETGSGIPLVLLRTGNYLEFYSDSGGNIAFNEPGMMSQPVFFSVLADGYNYTAGKLVPPYDPGVVLMTTPGTNATIRLNRTQLAERAYRLTGGGLYRDSILVGAPIPSSVAPSALSSASTGTIGQDTVMVANFKGNVFWTWGDTACPRSARQNNCDNTVSTCHSALSLSLSLAYHALSCSRSYPIFRRGMYTVGATSCLPSSSNSTCSAQLPPSLNYFTEEAGLFQYPSPRPMAPILPLEQNTWIAGLAVIHAGSFANTRAPPLRTRALIHTGTPQEALYANYFKNPGDGGDDKSAIQGMARWDESTEQVCYSSFAACSVLVSICSVHCAKRHSSFAVRRCLAMATQHQPLA
jgi:hypothetical protein